MSQIFGLRLKDIFFAVLFFTAYTVSAVVALRLLTQNGLVAILWPPSGIALAAALLGGRRFLPLVFLAAFTANWYAGADPLLAVVFALINLLEAGFGFYLLSSVRSIDVALRSSRDFFRLVVFGALIPPLLAALLGATALRIGSLTTQSFLTNFSYWWMGDSLGIVVIGTLILVWHARPRSTITSWRWVEVAVVLTLTTVIGQAIFLRQFAEFFGTNLRAFVLFLFIVWGAVRFGRHATSLMIAIIIVQIITGLITGTNYFGPGTSESYLPLIWLFVTTVSIVGMALATIVYERWRSIEDLSRARDHLEKVSEIAHIGGWELDLKTGKIHFSREALQIVEYPPDYPMTIEEALSLMDEEESQAHAARVQLAAEQGVGWDTEFAMKTRSGRQIWVRSQGEPERRNGRFMRLIGTVHDLTAQRQAQRALIQSETEFKRLVETANEGVWTVDVEGITQFVNDHMASMLGYQPAEMVGVNFLDFFPVQIRADMAIRFQERKRGEHAASEAVLQHKTGKRVEILVRTSAITDASGNFAGLMAMITDVTERKQMEEEIRLSESRYRQLIESSPDAIIVHQQGKIAFANRPAVRLIRASSERELLGREVLDFVAPEFRGVVMERIKVVDNPDDRVPLIEERFVCLDGSTVEVEVSATGTIFNGTPAIMVVARDITDRRRAEAQIRYLGQHDILTGLPNRALFADRIAQAIVLSEAHHYGFALLYLDLDHFKKINDSYGHQYGDTFLRQVAERLKSCLSPIDTVSRQGGDEFSILLNELKNPDDAATTAVRICEALGAPFRIEGSTLNVSCSVGIAVYPRDGRTTDALIRNADLAMYHAKSLGRNQYQFFSEELNQATHNRLQTEAALRVAVADNQFRVYYQPQLNIQTGAIEACEALIRWEHPQRGLLPPAEFIEIAEESGLINSIGSWVLEKVMADFHELDQQDFKDLRIAVNISALQLQQQDFADSVSALVSDRNIAKGRLELEVTESMLMADTERASEAIRRLTRQGVVFAVDDFGTGYSSLSHLRHLKIQHLKIDRSFVSDLERDADDAAIVRAVINLAQNLRLRTIAEGVETAAQKDFLRMQGCDLAQGYFIAKPMPLEQLLNFLRNWR